MLFQFFPSIWYSLEQLHIEEAGLLYKVVEQSHLLFPMPRPQITSKHLMVEVHAFTHLQQLNEDGSVVQNPSELRMRLDRFFEVLETAGFRLFHKEINVLWSHPNYLNMGVEYAFIRVSA